MLDCDVEVGEVLTTFRVGNPTSGSFPGDISNWELGHSDIPVQLDCTKNVPCTLYWGVLQTYPFSIVWFISYGSLKDNNHHQW